jgi:2-(1,2-epoxy-1,2-dihydrophenyl)acetyl-CoA isomerase
MSARYRTAGDVAVISFDRPERYNAIDESLSSATAAALQRAAGESRAAVITGTGKAFCSGADLAVMKEGYDRGQPDLGRYLDEIFHPLVRALVDCEVPTVAAVNGVAAGAGLGLALACDLRVMAESAFLTSAFTAIGLVPDSGTTWWLPHHLGVSRAIELAMTNRRVGPEEARDLGLVTEVTRDEEVVARAIEMADSLADLVPDSLVSTRRLIREAMSRGFEDALAAERAQQSRLGATPEHLEGVAAFLEKRPPDFRNPPS